MGLSHIQEYKKSKTISGWKESELDEDSHWSLKLQFKDVKGKATLREKVAIEISDLLLYNNVDYISEDEALESADNIIKLIGNGSKTKKK